MTADHQREKRAARKALDKLARLSGGERMTDEEVRRFLAHKTKQLVRRTA